MFKLQDPLSSSESPDEINWLFLDSEQAIGPTAYGTVSIWKEQKRKDTEKDCVGLRLRTRAVACGVLCQTWSAGY
jgi:hypothetical protein